MYSGDIGSNPIHIHMLKKIKNLHFTLSDKILFSCYFNTKDMLKEIKYSSHPKLVYKNHPILILAQEKFDYNFVDSNKEVVAYKCLLNNEVLWIEDMHLENYW